MARDVTTKGERPAQGDEVGRRGAPPEDPYGALRTLLASPDAADRRRGLGLAEKEIARVGSREARPLFEIISTLFYLDPLDRPDLVPILDEAVNLVVGFGEWVIPVLVDHLEAGDVKAQLAVGHALGRIGADAIAPLMAKYDKVADPAVRPFVLYALGKIASPRVVQAVPLMLEALRSDELEIRDTAARALGRMADSIPAGGMDDELARAVVAALHGTLDDANAGVRAKALRSLGKLAKGGHMTPAERKALGETCRRLLGEGVRLEMARPYVVTREAEEALTYTRE